jgi:uncharacterized protein Smg (DUF494 family)
MWATPVMLYWSRLALLNVLDRAIILWNVIACECEDLALEGLKRVLFIVR